MATCFDFYEVMFRPFELIVKLRWPEDDFMKVETCSHM
jgi:hypothetical protein